jgi:hypothetical protein
LMLFGRFIESMLIKINVIRSIHRFDVNQNQCYSVDWSSRCWSKLMLFGRFIESMLIKINVIRSIHRVDVNQNQCYSVDSSIRC